MFEDLFAQAKPSQGSSKLFELLAPDEKKIVLEFVEWLKTTTMSTNSVNSYKSYVTKAILKTDGKLEGKLTNDEKSGVRKFQAWFATRPVEVVDEDVEQDDEQDDDENV